MRRFKIIIISQKNVTVIKSFTTDSTLLPAILVYIGTRLQYGGCSVPESRLINFNLFGVGILSIPA